MPLILSGTSGVPAASINGQLPDANAPSGSVVQITSGSAVPGTVATTSTIFIDTGIIEVAITPSLANSRVDIFMTGFQTHVNPEADNWGGFLHIYRSVAGGAYAAVNGNPSAPLWGEYINQQFQSSWADRIGHMRFLDSPTYTLGQEIKYRAFYRRSSRGASGFYASHTGGLSSYGGTCNVIGIAMEIAS